MKLKQFKVRLVVISFNSATLELSCHFVRALLIFKKELAVSLENYNSQNTLCQLKHLKNYYYLHRKNANLSGQYE